MIAPQMERAESGLWVPERSGVIGVPALRVVRKQVLYRRPGDFGMFGNDVAGWVPGVTPWYVPSPNLRQLIEYELAPAYDSSPGLQLSTFGSSGETIQITSVNAGSLLVVGMSTPGDAFTSSLVLSSDNPSDPTSLTVAEVNYDGSASAGGGALGFLANASAGTHNIKFTYVGGAFIIIIVVAEYTGVATVSPKDSSTKSTGQSGTSIGTGTTAALAETGELCISVCSIAATKTITAPGTATLRSAASGKIGFADEILAATTAVSRTFTLDTGTNGAGYIATFKQASINSVTARSYPRGVQRGVQRGVA